MSKLLFQTALSVIALLAATSAWCTENLGASCSLSAGGMGIQALYPSREFNARGYQFSSYTADMLSLTFRRVAGSRDIEVKIEGQDNIIETQSDSLLAVHNGINGTASGFLAGDPADRVGNRHLEFNIQASNSAHPIQVLCDAMVVQDGDDRRAAGIQAMTAPRVGVSIVDFFTP